MTTLSTLQRLIRNTTVLISSTLATWLISTASLALSARYLGARDYGVLATASAIAAIMGLVIALGMETYILRTVARDPLRAATLPAVAIAVRVLVFIPVIASFAAFTLLAHANRSLAIATYLMAATVLVNAVTSVLVATSQGQERVAPTAVSAVLLNLIDLGLTVLLVRLHGTVVLFAALALPASILLLVLNLGWLRQRTNLHWRVTPADMRSLVVNCLPFWLFSAFLTFYTYIDTIILAARAGAAAAGIYAPATRMFGIALFLPGILSVTSAPLLSRLTISSPTEFRSAGRKLINVHIIAAIPLSIGLATFAPTLIGVVYGQRFAPSVPVLAVLSLCILPMFLNMQISSLLTASDRQWLWTAALAAGCVINPLLNLWLIPQSQAHWHNAAIGAAIALLITEVLQALYGSVLLRAIVLCRNVAVVLLRTCLAGGAQFGIVYLSQGYIWPPVQQAGGIAAFCVLAWLTRLLPEDDLVQLRIAARRLAPR